MTETVFFVSGRQFEHKGELPEVHDNADGSYTVHIDNNTVEVFAVGSHAFTDGNSFEPLEVTVEGPREQLIKERFALSTMGTSSSTSQHIVKAPMPGLVKKVLVAEGDEVAKDTPILILEAMKMENILAAGKEGRIVALKTTEGKNVEKNAELCVIS